MCRACCFCVAVFAYGENDEMEREIEVRRWEEREGDKAERCRVWRIKNVQSKEFIK